jgi:undecaprenyl-diphosphatase
VNVVQAVVLGVVEGVTEFLPVSSTGHLTVVEALMGLPVDDAGVTAFTAVIQVGAIVAVLVSFRSDVRRLARAWVRGLLHREARADLDHRLAWYVVAGSVPVGVVGFLGRHLVAGGLRSLWVVAVALVAWSAVMLLAERTGSQRRGEHDLTLRDAVVIGLVQCVALVPGVSRSGATISAGLLRGLDRVTATRLSFLLSIPALTAAGAYEAVGSAGAIGGSVGWGPTVVATLVSLVVAYACIAWLLRFVSRHPITVFVGYRVVLGVVLAGALATGVLTTT